MDEDLKSQCDKILAHFQRQCIRYNNYTAQGSWDSTIFSYVKSDNSIFTFCFAWLYSWNRINARNDRFHQYSFDLAGTTDKSIRFFFSTLPHVVTGHGFYKLLSELDNNELILCEYWYGDLAFIDCEWQPCMIAIDELVGWLKELKYVKPATWKMDIGDINKC